MVCMSRIWYNPYTIKSYAGGPMLSFEQKLQILESFPKFNERMYLSVE